MSDVDGNPRPARRPYYPTITRGAVDSNRGAVGARLVVCCRRPELGAPDGHPWCVVQWQRGWHGQLCPWCAAAWDYLQAVHGVDGERGPKQ